MKVVSAAVAAFFFAGASAAFAGSIDASGVGLGSSQNEVMPVSDGLVVVKTVSTYDGFEQMAADSPFVGAKGSCWGSLMIKAGAVSGNGLCNYTDTDGDTAIMSWNSNAITPDGRNQGTWSVEGGTGKWAAASGGGTFDAGDAGGTYTNNITGEFVLP